MTKTAKSLGLYGPLLAWMFVISLASTSGFSSLNTSLIIRPLLLWIFPNISEGQIAIAHIVTRKLAHFSEYAVLGILAARAFSSSANHFLRQRWFQMAVLLVVTYALLDELHQSFVPERTASIYDSAIDIAGGVTALLLIRHRLRYLAAERRG